MREIREGDRVKFLNDTGTGVVVSIIDKTMVLVRTDEDDFEYPVLKKELIVRKEPGDDEELDRVEEVEEVERVEKVGRVEEVEEVDRVEKVGRVEEVEKVDRVEKVEKRVRVKSKDSIEEVDLHINEIVNDISGMTSGEIVDIQIARFRTALDGAVRAKQKKIIFIHGKGAGKLKREISKIVDNEYHRCRCQDASFREYGYGATMVLIK